VASFPTGTNVISDCAEGEPLEAIKARTIEKDSAVQQDALGLAESFIVGVFIVVSVIISLLLPFRYMATTVILPPQNQSAGSALMSQLGGPMASLA
jgi:hypothetical protein